MKIGKPRVDLLEIFRTGNKVDNNAEDTWLLLYLVPYREAVPDSLEYYDSFKVNINDKNLLESIKYKYIFMNISTSNIIVLNNKEVVERKYPVSKTLGLSIDEQSQEISIHTRLDCDFFNAKYIDNRYTSDGCNVHIENSDNLDNEEHRLRKLAYTTKNFEFNCADTKCKFNGKTIEIIELQYCLFLQAYKELGEDDTRYRNISKNCTKYKSDMVIYFEKTRENYLIRMPGIDYILRLALTGQHTKAEETYAVMKTGQNIDIYKLNTSRICNWNKMFRGTYCESININKLDFSKASKIRKMFIECNIDALDISNIDLSQFNTKELDGLFMDSRIKELRLNIGNEYSSIGDVVNILTLIFKGIKEIPDTLYINLVDYENYELEQFGKRIEHSSKWVNTNNVGGLS